MEPEETPAQDHGAARAVIGRHFVQEGDRVLGVRTAGTTMIVATEGGSWALEQLRDPATGIDAGPYRVYDVRRYIADLPGRPHGAAVLPDGRTFRLSERDGMKAFYEATRESLTPLAVAVLICRYQGGDDGIVLHQNLLMRRSDLHGLLTDERVRSIPDLIEPRWTGEPGRDLRLELCTFFLAPEPQDGVYRVGINRWLVEDGDDGSLGWTVDSVARGLDSPRYSHR